MGSVCVVRAKRKLSGILKGLKSAGSFLLHTKGYVSAGKNRMSSKKKYWRKAS